MFRRVEDTLASDPTFPEDLEELGFFINETGHIRMIQAPEKDYYFHASNDDRTNERLRDAMQTCSQKAVEKRLSALGISRLYFPTLDVNKPNGPHIPILAPAAEVLRTRKRVFIVVNDASQDLGILAYRQLQRKLGLNGGSVVDFAKKLVLNSSRAKEIRDGTDHIGLARDGGTIECNDDIPGLVVLNTGQLLYSHKFNKAVTLRGWSALKRKSIAHDMIEIHEANRVEGHRDAQEHIKTAFDEIVTNTNFVAPDAEVYVIAIENGVDNFLHVLNANLEKYGPRITALAAIEALEADTHTNDSLKNFLHQRTRQWRATNDTYDPCQCIEVPTDYSQDVQRENKGVYEPMQIDWLEQLPLGTQSAAFDTLENAVHFPTGFQSTSYSQPSRPPLIDTFFDPEVLCPTFSGGESEARECVFTSAPVQEAILAFFAEVAQDPKSYRNPAFTLSSVNVPQPTPNHPLSLDTFKPPPGELTLGQSRLVEAQEVLHEWQVSLADTPTKDPTLIKGRHRLQKKIHEQEIKVKNMMQEILADGELKAEEARGHEVDKQHLQRMKEGQQIAFAGTMVGSELVEAIGLKGTAQEL